MNTKGALQNLFPLHRHQLYTLVPTLPLCHGEEGEEAGEGEIRRLLKGRRALEQTSPRAARTMEQPARRLIGGCSAPLLLLQGRLLQGPTPSPFPCRTESTNCKREGGLMAEITIFSACSKYSSPPSFVIGDLVKRQKGDRQSTRVGWVEALPGNVKANLTTILGIFCNIFSR